MSPVSAPAGWLPRRWARTGVGVKVPLDRPGYKGAVSRRVPVEVDLAQIVWADRKGATKTGFCAQLPSSLVLREDPDAPSTASAF